MNTCFITEVTSRLSKISKGSNKLIVWKRGELRVGGFEQKDKVKSFVSYMRPENKDEEARFEDSSLRLFDGKSRTFICTDETRNKYSIISYANYHKNYYYIHTLYTSKEYRHNGFALKMLDHVVGEIAKENKDCEIIFPNKELMNAKSILESFIERKF